MPRDTVFSVYDVLELLDSTGISIGKRKRLRKRQYVSKGPNYFWHIDSYDKLKPYSIAINGCIGGCLMQQIVTPGSSLTILYVY